jgi:hypothetical protein
VIGPCTAIGDTVTGAKMRTLHSIGAAPRGKAPSKLREALSGNACSFPSRRLGGMNLLIGVYPTFSENNSAELQSSFMGL